MPVAAAFIEIRFRRTDSIGQWTFVKIPAGQDSVRLDGVERGVQYQIEARSVAASGAASDWVAQTHIVNSLTITPLVPIGFAAAQLTDGVHLTWSASDVQRSDVEYEIQRTGDLSGAPDPAGWVTINRTKALRFTDGVTDSVTRWYQVRASTYGGVTTAFSTAVSSAGKPPASPSDNLIKNGNFELGSANWGASPNWGGTSNVSFLTGVSGLPVGSSELKTPATATMNQESKEYIPVDVNKTYLVEAWVKIPAPLTGALGLYLGLVEYDSSKAMLNHNAVSGPTNLFCLANNVASTTGNTYQYLSAEVSGDGGTTPGLTQFHTGTKYVRAIGLFNWSGAGTPQQIEVISIRLSEVAAGNVRAIKLLKNGISSDLNTQGSVVPQAYSNTPFTALSYDDTLGVGSGSKVSWVAFTVYNPDGTTISIPASTDSTQKATVPTPTLSTVAGGTKGARTYFVRIAFLIDGGIRGFSAETSIAVAANFLLKVTSPANTPPWTAYSIFISQSTNTETWESTISEGGNNNGIPFGTDWTEPTAALATHGPQFTNINSKGLDGDIHAAVPYNVGLFFYPFWDRTLSLVRMYGGANSGNGLVVGSASTPDNVRGMYLDNHVALAASGLTFNTITVAQGSSGTTTGVSNTGGCPIAGTEIKPLGCHALAHKRKNREWIEIEVEDGRVLTASRTHKLYTDKGRKISLNKLKPGQTIMMDNGLQKITRKERKTFDGEMLVVSMPQVHLYYANGFLSSNIKLPHQ
jgi:hypothetical protein